MNFNEYNKLFSKLNPAIMDMLDISTPIQEAILSVREPFQRIALLCNTATKALSEPLRCLSESLNVVQLHLFSENLNASLRQSVQRLSVQLSEISELYDLDACEFFSGDTSSRFIDLSSSVIDSLASESAIPCDEYSDSFDAVKSTIEKCRLSIGDICNIIMLIVTLWALVRSYVPDARIDHIESEVQQTVDVGIELIELKERELEVQAQQLEESKKQTQLLEKLVEADLSE